MSVGEWRRSSLPIHFFPFLISILLPVTSGQSPTVSSGSTALTADLYLRPREQMLDQKNQHDS